MNIVIREDKLSPYLKKTVIDFLNFEYGIFLLEENIKHISISSGDVTVSLVSKKDKDFKTIESYISEAH